ncbi:MAG TPA: DUF896 domain-containing protein [Bacillota bacterium]
MLTNEKLNRINALARKAKKEGLTDSERKEQQQLRKEYLKNVRQSFKNQLTAMTVIDPLGNDVTPKKVRDMQERNKKH